MKYIKEEIKNIKYYELKEAEQPIGWDCYLYNKENRIVAGGTHESREMSLRIGFAEFAERLLSKRIANSNSLSTKFRTKEFPTSCGFAAGFDRTSTENRALLEGIERWAWSKWIDEKIKINKISILKSSLERFANYQLAPFSKVDFYFQEIDCSKFANLNKFRRIVFGALLCYTENGVFLGSRVSNDFTDILNHSSIEANRALKIHCDLSKKCFDEKKNFFYSRLNFFASNKNSIPNLDEFNSIAFPCPTLNFQETLSEENSRVFISRAILSDFIPWNLGDEKRFIY